MLVDFSYEVRGLDITLYNLSTDYTDCEWKAIHEGLEVDVSTDCEKFDFAATAPGFYTITLKISEDVDGVIEESIKGIEIYLVDAEGPTLMYSIIKQVELIYPGMAEDNWEAIERYKIKWQTILFPALNETLDPDLGDEFMHDESKWPYFWNTLIAQLIARDIFLDIQGQLSGVQPGTQKGGGPIKKITTGPVDTEWHHHAKMMDAIFKPDGLLDELDKRICAMGAIIDISFSWCKAKPFFPIKITPDTDVKTVNKLLKYGASYILTTFYN